MQRYRPTLFNLIQKTYVFGPVPLSRLRTTERATNPAPTRNSVAGSGALMSFVLGLFPAKLMPFVVSPPDFTLRICLALLTAPTGSALVGCSLPNRVRSDIVARIESKNGYFSFDFICPDPQLRLHAHHWPKLYDNRSCSLAFIFLD